MIVVRATFVAKPGMASKLAAMMHDCFGPNARVLTDLVGDFNTVVLEHEAESWEAYEAHRGKLMSDPAFKEKMAGYTDLYLTGKREVFQVVG